MNTADIKRAVTNARKAKARAEQTEKGGDYGIAAGFYRNAAALWRIAKDENAAGKCDIKADECQRKDHQ
jgi:hypothetical protein